MNEWLEKYRQKHPEYAHIGDVELARALYDGGYNKKMSWEDFAQRISLDMAAPPDEEQRGPRQAAIPEAAAFSPIIASERAGGLGERARAMAQGLPFVGTFADELEAAVRPGATVADVRQRMEEYEGRGTPTFDALMGSALSIGPALSLLRLGPMGISAAMGLGGAEGVAIGAGTGTTPEERAVRGASGGAAGLALTMLGVPVAKTASLLGGAGRNLLENLRAMRTGSLSGRAARRETAALGEELLSGGPIPEIGEADMLADVLEGGERKLGSYAGELHGSAEAAEARAALKGQMAARGEALPEDVMGVVEDVTGMPRGQSRMLYTEQAIDDSRRFYSKQYRSLYDEMERQGVLRSRKLSGLVERPEVRNAMNAARAEMNQWRIANGQRLLPDDFVDAEVLDRTERVLRGLGNDKRLENWGVFKDLSARMQDALGDFGPYQAVRSLYAKQEVVKQASTGRIFFQNSREGKAWQTAKLADIREWWNRADDRAKDALQQAVGADLEGIIQTRLQNVTPESPLRELGDKLSDRLRVIYGADRVADMNRRLDALGRRVMTNREVAGPIRRAERTLPGAGMDAELTALQAGAYVPAHQYGASLRTIIQGMYRNPALRRAYGQFGTGLLSGDPVAGLRALQDAMSWSQQMRNRSLRSRWALPLAGGQIGGQVGGDLLGNR